MNAELDTKPAAGGRTGAACLMHLPVPLYGSVMGINGLAIALAHAGGPAWVGVAGTTLLHANLVWFLGLTTAYLIKVIAHPDEVRAEWNHPVRMNFFPAISISLLLFAVGYLPVHEGMSKVAWMAGAALQLILLLRTLRVWVFRDAMLQTMNPAWFIPVVGNLIVPIAGVAHAPIEVSWFYFSIGIVYWILLFGITLHRVVFEKGLPPKLLPTLFILIAPPAVGFLAYMRLTDELDSLARILYFHALFTGLMIFAFADRFVRLPFYLSWWAYTFPLAALSLASFRYYEATGGHVFHGIGVAVLALLALIATWNAWKTLEGFRTRSFCVPE